MHTPEISDGGTVIDLFSHKVFCKRMMRAIERVRFSAVIDNRLYLRLITAPDIDADWLTKLTFRITDPDDGTSSSIGIAAVKRHADGIMFCTGPLFPAMRRRRVEEHCTIELESPNGITQTFDYRPVFVRQAQ